MFLEMDDIIDLIVLGAVRKRRPQSGGEGELFSADILRTRGVLQGEGGSSDADMRTFWRKKTSDFSKFVVCPYGQRGRGVEPVRTFRKQGVRGGQFFAILCGRLSWTAPYRRCVCSL